MKKIIYFINRIDLPGGMEKVLTIKANYLVEKFNYDVVIVTMNSYGNQPFFNLNKKIRLYDLQLQNNFRKGLFNRILKRNQVTSQEHFEKVKEIIFNEKPDFCISLFSNDLYFLYKIKDGSKKIIEFHNSRQSFLIESGKGISRIIRIFYRKQLLKKLEKIILKYDQFVCLTEEDYIAWGKLENSCYIYNPFFFEIQEKSADHSNKTILSVGRIHYQKGFDLLIDIWEKIEKRFPDWNLKIVGRREGVKDNLDEIIEKKNLKRIEVISATKDIQKYYYESSLYVSTSRYEGFPLTLLEAQSCGLPIVAFRTPTGPSEIIKDNEDGLLATYLDEQDLADKLMILMKDEEKRREFGVKAKENVKRFSIDKIMKNWDSLFNQLN
ncbi:MAG: glycosyltransferase family 4 protein [Flavobacteriales bacterium]